jgi:hypothetical protein
MYVSGAGMWVFVIAGPIRVGVIMMPAQRQQRSMRPSECR